MQVAVPPRADEKTLTMFRRNSIGFIFQAYNLMPTLTAKENLEFIGELCENAMDAETALERVGLTGRMDNYPAQMSGGQQQRVSIARALVKRPRMILADEPTAALDYETSIEVLTVLEEVIRGGYGRCPCRQGHRRRTVHAELFLCPYLPAGGHCGLLCRRGQNDRRPKGNIFLIALGLIVGCGVGTPLAQFEVMIMKTGNRRYITTPSILACFLSVVICVIFASIINAIALRKTNHLSLTNVSGN